MPTPLLFFAMSSAIWRNCFSALASPLQKSPAAAAGIDWPSITDWPPIMRLHHIGALSSGQHASSSNPSLSLKKASVAFRSRQVRMTDIGSWLRPDMTFLLQDCCDGTGPPRQWGAFGGRVWRGEGDRSDGRSLLLADQLPELDVVGGEQRADARGVHVGDDDQADLGRDVAEDSLLLHLRGLVLVVVGRRHEVDRLG